ncbi:MAG: translation elongation factor Ts [bacterium]
MAITTEQVKELRDKTGVSVMQCKKALEEAGGDMEKALLILKKKSTEIAAKKSDREATAGVIVKAEKNGFALLLTLRCETDFVAKNADFVAIATTLASAALEQGKAAAEAMAPELISAGIQKLGENLQLGEIVVMEAPVVGVYVHDGRVGTMVGLSGGNQEVAKDIAMHVAAMNPEYKTRADVPEEAKTNVKALFAEEVAKSGKPADIQEKMLAGKLDTFFKERTLVDQPFIKNPDQTIEKLLAANSATLVGFVRVATA